MLAMAVQAERLLSTDIMSNRPTDVEAAACLADVVRVVGGTPRSEIREAPFAALWLCLDPQICGLGCASLPSRLARDALLDLFLVFRDEILSLAVHVSLHLLVHSLDLLQVLSPALELLIAPVLVFEALELRELPLRQLGVHYLLLEHACADGSKSRQQRRGEKDDGLESVIDLNKNKL